MYLLIIVNIIYIYIRRGLLQQNGLDLDTFWATELVGKSQSESSNKVKLHINHVQVASHLSEFKAKSQTCHENGQLESALRYDSSQ